MGTAKLPALLWDEWVAYEGVECDARISEMSGIISSLPHRECKNADFLEFSCSRLIVLRRFFKLLGSLKKQGEVPFFISENRAMLAGTSRHGTRLTFFVARELLMYLGAHDVAHTSSACAWNWLRGCFGACGALYMPRSGYYLVFRSSQASLAIKKAERILKRAKFSMSSRVLRGGAELILRDQQQIATFMAKLGLYQTTLALEEIAIVRSMKNRANMLVNCDHANIKKSIDAAQKQLALIETLDRLGLTEQLSRPFRELVELRRRNQSANLKEIGQSLSEPVSKSTVEYRWRKIEELIFENL